MRGELSAAFGERTVESDRFHRKMDFTAAAGATWEGLQGTAVEAPIRALGEGINRYLEVAPALPLEFRLLEYEPDPWIPVDTALIAKAVMKRVYSSTTFTPCARVSVQSLFESG